MQKLHANAALTVRQRREMAEQFAHGASLKELAAAYHVGTKTVQRWVHRTEFTDRSSAPTRRRSHRPPA
jgi:transposase